MPPPFGRRTAPIVGTWTSEIIKNSLGRFPAGQDTRWGLLKWEQSAEREEDVQVDIINVDTNEVIVEGIDYSDNGVDLSAYSAVQSKNIKIRFRLYSR